MTTSVELFEVFEATARAAPARVLIGTCPARLEVTAGSLLDAALMLSSRMRAEGVLPGDVVLVRSSSGAALIAGMLATWACDASALAVDFQLSRVELQDLASTFKPRLTLAAEHQGESLPRIIGPRAAHAGSRPGAAVIKLTSGSTGTPRGIAVSVPQLLADGRHIVEGMGIHRDVVHIGAIPLSHSYGMDSLILPMLMQGCVVLLVDPPLPEPLAEALCIEQPAIFPGVPYLYDMLLRSGSRSGPAFKPSGAKIFISAGAPLRSGLASSFRETFGLPIRAFYGTSETGGITFDASADGDAAIRGDGCVGTPLPGVIVEVNGDEERVAVRGDAVATGYISTTDAWPSTQDSSAPTARSATAQTGGRFESGAFLTGDTGRFDETGRLHLTGRLDSVVNISGRKVYPIEIETILTEMEGIGEAAVLAEPDEARGQALVACLVADSAVTRERVLAHLRGRLAPYKLPRRILFLEQMPRNQRGKLDRAALSRKAREDLD